MKKNILLLLAALMFAFCAEENEQSQDNSQEPVENKKAEFSVDTVVVLNNKVEIINYDELEGIVKNNLHELGFGEYEFEKAAPVICDTSYLCESGETFELNVPAINFEPNLLVVSHGKLYLLNSKMDSKYEIKLPFKVHTAAWSPMKKTELYILGREEIKYTKDTYTELIEDPIFNLHLYRFDFASLEIEKLSTFYDKSLKLSRYYLGDAPTFFGEVTAMIVDKEKKRIYYDCLHPYEPDGTYYYLLTYTYDFETKKCSLMGKTKQTVEWKIGKKVDAISTGYLAKDKIDLDTGFVYFEHNGTQIKVAASIYEEQDSSRSEWDTCPEMVYVAAFPKSSDWIVCSPSIVCGMDVKEGNICLLNPDGKFNRILLKNRVLYYHLSIRESSNGSLLFGNTYMGTRSLDELYLFDPNFELKNKFDKVANYELRD